MEDDDAQEELDAMSAAWDARSRSRLRERYAARRDAGAPPAAAVMLAMADVLAEGLMHP